MSHLYKIVLSVLLAILVLFQIFAYAITELPAAPQSLTSTAIGQTSISLKWSVSANNESTASYLIYQNSVYIGTASEAAYTVTGLKAATTYSFFVKAKDAGGNTSNASNTFTVTTAAANQLSTKIVAGYYASWSAYSGYTPDQIPASSLTSIHYAFAKISDDLKIELGDPSIDLSNFTRMNALKQKNPQLKTLISVGGWNDSGKFSDAALTDASRAAFADSVGAFLKQYGFDGVDIDWEYPVSGGLTANAQRNADKTNFTLLLQKLREKLDVQGALDKKKYLLTIAGGADSSYVSNTELNLISRYVDYAVLMTYDIHGPWDSYTDLNAPLYTPTEFSPQYKWSVDKAVKTWEATGFPASKLVLGVPFYGYLYSGVSGSGSGIYKSFSRGSSIPYDKILSSYFTDTGYTKYAHADGKVPWLFNGSTFISYDDELSLLEKAGYIRKNNLAGASIWELSQNQGGQLLHALTWKNPFTDLPVSAWYYSAAAFMAERNLFKGTSDTTFEPNEPVTRAMFVTALGRLYGVNPSDYPGTISDDVPVNEWYSPYMNWAAQNGIITGYGNGEFGPNDFITREQICVILIQYCSYAKIELPEAMSKAHFADENTISSWANAEVSTAQMAQLIQGTENNLFYPQNSAARAEVATILMRLVLNIIKE